MSTVPHFWATLFWPQVAPHICRSELYCILEEDPLQISAVSSLCSSLLSGPLFCRLSSPWSCWTFQYISLTQGVQQVLPGFPFSPPLPRVENSLKVVSWGNVRVQLIWFPSMRNHCLLLTDIQDFENQCFICVSSFVLVWLFQMRG